MNFDCYGIVWLINNDGLFVADVHKKYTLLLKETVSHGS